MEGTVENEPPEEKIGWKPGDQDIPPEFGPPIPPSYAGVDSFPKVPFSDDDFEMPKQIVLNPAPKKPLPKPRPGEQMTLDVKG
jgi:hypothetical protein